MAAPKTADKQAEAPQQEQAQAAPKPERKLLPMEPARIKEASFLTTHYVATASEGAEPEDLMNPAYWAHIAATLKPWDRIDVRANDGSWWAQLLVLEASRSWARVHCLGIHNLTTADVAQTLAEQMQLPYEVAYKGPHNKWSVIRRSDNQVVHDQEETSEGAVTWMRERIKVEAR